jgi:hypothetical protein
VLKLEQRALKLGPTLRRSRVQRAMNLVGGSA